MCSTSTGPSDDGSRQEGRRRALYELAETVAPAFSWLLERSRTGFSTGYGPPLYGWWLYRCQSLMLVEKRSLGRPTNARR
jgi:hypothetical protein